MCLGEVVVGRAGRIPIQARVVDEHVEAPGVGLDRCEGRADGGVVVDVELQRSHVLAPLNGRRVARTGEDEKVVVAGQLGRDLLADPAIGPRDQGDPQILFLSSTLRPITIFWISEVPSPISSSGASR